MFNYDIHAKQQEILSHLSEQPIHVSEISRLVRISQAEVYVEASQLILDGVAVMAGPGLYKRKYRDGDKGA